ncbi:MAG TPA: hypothetical protein VHY09_02405 [Candidatus Methylacidiphilales bacterium]|jgi:hypothetical protein|nr:hypothetical protein [Candidatus Methylacidiphilales bacterium]
MLWRRVLAVFVGVVSSFAITVVLSVVLGLLMLAYWTLCVLSLRGAARQMDFTHLTASVPFLLATLGLGGFALLIGGFLAGWVARSGQVMTGLTTGITSTVISIPFFFWYPAWYDAACIVATIAPAAMGGYLARLMASLRHTPPPATS